MLVSSSSSDLSLGHSVFSKPGGTANYAMEAIQSLVLIAREPINTWLMEKMASNASKSLCQQLVDKCLWLQILKTRANNKHLAKEMETTKKTIYFSKETPRKETLFLSVISAPCWLSSDLVDETAGMKDKVNEAIHCLQIPLTWPCLHELAETASNNEENKVTEQL
ncbi:hypothetical protein ACA910_012546 [Epithemia clementina (nom. ined.)]